MGIARHRMPLRSRYTIPSKQARSEANGRRPFGCGGDGGEEWGDLLPTAGR